MRTILLVDDSELFLEVVKYHLEREGFAVMTASDVATLRNLVEETTPDLVVRDVEMPDVSQTELAQALAAIGAPVWLYSALDEDELASRAKTFGVDGYVCKNDGVDVLLDRVKALFT